MSTIAPAPHMPPLHDGALVAAHLAGTAPGGDALVARFHGRLVRRMRWWFRDPAMAEDVAQEAWANAFAALATFDLTAPFWPWLKAIGDNAARAHLRSSHRDGRLRETPIAPADLARAGRAVDPTAAVDDALVLEACLRQLPARHRDVVTAVHLEGRCQREVAEAMGLTHTALRQVLLRARRGMQRAGQGLAGLPFFPTVKAGGWTGGTAKATGVGGTAVAATLAVAVPALLVLSLGLGALRVGDPAEAATGGSAAITQTVPVKALAPSATDHHIPPAITAPAAPRPAAPAPAAEAGSGPDSADRYADSTMLVPPISQEVPVAGEVRVTRERQPPGYAYGIRDDRSPIADGEVTRVEGSPGHDGYEQERDIVCPVVGAAPAAYCEIHDQP